MMTMVGGGYWKFEWYYKCVRAFARAKKKQNAQNGNEKSL